MKLDDFFTQIQSDELAAMLGLEDWFKEMAEDFEDN